MAKFDHVGDVSPALLAQIGAGERVMVPVDHVRYRDPTVTVGRVRYDYPNPTGRIPHTLWHYFETLDGPGTATIATGLVGEVRIGVLRAGEILLLHAGALLAHESTMGYDRVTLATYPMPRSPINHFLTAVRLTGPGNFAFQTHGNALTFQLKEGEALRSEPAALLSLTPDVKVQVMVFGGSPHFPPMHYFPLVHLTGPGTVLVHSGRRIVPGVEGGGGA
jgi:uncharacterized protein (AIM24 family)